jgi:hypothetical protein
MYRVHHCILGLRRDFKSFPTETVLWIRIRIEEGKNAPKKTKAKQFHVLKGSMFSFEGRMLLL